MNIVFKEHLKAGSNYAANLLWLVIASHCEKLEIFLTFCPNAFNACIKAFLLQLGTSLNGPWVIHKSRLKCGFGLIRWVGMQCSVWPDWVIFESFWYQFFYKSSPNIYSGFLGSFECIRFHVLVYCRGYFSGKFRIISGYFIFQRLITLEVFVIGKRKIEKSGIQN